MTRVTLLRTQRGPEISTDEPGPERHVGLSFGLLPSLVADVQYGLSYSYLSLDVWGLLVGAPPLIGSLGSGVSLAFSDNGRWRLDLFAKVHVVPKENADLGLGLGVGAHYTAPGGFTFAAKLPLIGSAIGSLRSWQQSDRVLLYYQLSFFTDPILSFGYRF